MDLREALDGYIVTAVPQRGPSLSIVWSPAHDEAADDDVGEGGAARGASDEAGLLAILDDYRITRVPKAS